MQKQITEKDLRILATHSKGISFEKAVGLANEKKLRLISNRETKKVLVETDIWRNFEDAFPVWTGTMLVYTKPNKMLGPVVEYRDKESRINWIFPVPAGLRRLKNAALAMEHPDYELDVKKTKITVNVPENRIMIIENFPKEKEGRHMVSQMTSVPTNARNSIGNSVCRTETRVGPLTRGCFIKNFSARSFVYAYDWPSTPHGALAVGSEVQLPKDEEGLVERIRGAFGQFKELFF